MQGSLIDVCDFVWNLIYAIGVEPRVAQASIEFNNLTWTQLWTDKFQICEILLVDILVNNRGTYITYLRPVY